MRNWVRQAEVDGGRRSGVSTDEARRVADLEREVRELRRFCSACHVFRHAQPGEAGCTGCGRVLAVKDGYCRLCRRQASLEDNAVGGLTIGEATPPSRRCSSRSESIAVERIGEGGVVRRRHS